MKAEFRARLERMEKEHPAILSPPGPTPVPAIPVVRKQESKPVRRPAGRDALIPAHLRDMIEEKKRNLKMPFTRLYVDGDGNK